MAKLDLKVGQTVWVLEVYYDGRFPCIDVLEDSIERIYTKSFSLRNNSENRYDLANGRQVPIGREFVVFDEVEKDSCVEDCKLSVEIMKNFYGFYPSGLTLDQLRRIAAIINEPKPE